MLSHQRTNNFDFLRLLFASSVIISHAYPLTGSGECDPICQVFGIPLTLSYLGVSGFFVISGYLVFQSLNRSRTVIQFISNRILRIFPGLLVVLVLTLIMAITVNTDKAAILNDHSFLTYLPRNLLLYPLQYSIDGVFENNPYPKVINGSLWTLPYEFTMYIFLALLFIVKDHKRTLIVILLSVWALSLFANLFLSQILSDYSYYINAARLSEMACFFIAGSLLALLPERIIQHLKTIVTILFALILTSFFTHTFDEFKYFIWPPLVILIGSLPINGISNIGQRIGDLSYGIYIYAFPVQQILMNVFVLTPVQLILFTFLITLPLAWLSWHLVEKQALKLKKKAS